MNFRFRQRAHCATPLTPARQGFLRATVALAGLLCTSAALGGGGPENVAVVVNSKSWASLAVANEYVHLRAIPPSNVIYLDGLAEFDSVGVDLFRDRILKPVLETIRERRLADQIDYLVYSTDFPYAVDARADFKGVEVPSALRPVGSLTGLTYLAQDVLAGSRDYTRLDVNRYVRRALPLASQQALSPADQQRSQQAMALIQEGKWAEATKLYLKLVERYPRSPTPLYNLACCQARQDQPEEALAVLKRAVDAGWLDYRHTAADEDLLSLRERRGFRELLDRMKNTVIKVQPSHGFRAAYGWNEAGEIAASGKHYLLSTMLGVTSGRGNSVREVLASLRRSAAADGTQPSGTIYYLVNNDIRSRTREPAFASAVAALKKLRVSAEILTGKLPQKRRDVMGAMVGTANFDWKASGSRILPGAICEHLTSAGGVMRDGAGQTPLTEFIRCGAAGSSGTVTEPYAIQAKFPLAFLHVHYARGCSLAEAFYQSVAGPYQLLIVGDPLCQPWARAPEVVLRGVEAGATLRGRVTLRPQAKPDSAGPCDHFELFVDGRRHGTVRPGGAFTLDLTTLAGGHHELRCVAVAADPIETQGRCVLPINVDNHGHELRIKPPADTSVAWNRPLRLFAELRGARRITFLHNGRPLATISGPADEVEIDPRQLGLGPVQIQAVGVIEASPPIEVRSPPLALNVRASGHLRALRVRGRKQLADGMLVTFADHEPVVVKDTREADWLLKAGGEPGQSFELAAYFEVPAADVYQFHVRSNADPVVEVDGNVLMQPEMTPWQVLPVALRAGTHQLRVRGQVRSGARLDLRFGGPGARRLDGGRFRHVGGVGKELP